MIKLSEAIRLGAMIRPQGFNGVNPREEGSWVYFQILYPSAKRTSCALVAALEAVGALPLRWDNYGALERASKLWPILDLQDPKFATPKAMCDENRFGAYLALELSDSHKLSREATAPNIISFAAQKDWLRKSSHSLSVI